jgi:hypothetical protein
MSPRRTFIVASLLAVTANVWPAEARAQQYLIGATGEVSSGMEGGGQLAMRRTRTRLRLGGDLRIDESPDDIFEFAVLAEVEPQSGFGGDIRYARMVGTHFMVDAGILGIFAPSSLYGVGAGLTYRLPITKSSQVTFGPEADFFFLGTDLPDNIMLWQLRFQAGFRVDL